jgi:hypothetical protein
MIGYGRSIRNRWMWKIVLWLVLAPVRLPFRLYRWTGRMAGAWVVRTRDALPCSGCEDTVSLVGRWQCGMCGYTFDGFAFARCEVCGAVPPFIECQTCGIGIQNPLLF